MRQILIRGPWGLGDNVYSRPFVRAAATKYEVWLDTPWPELYEDIDIRFVRGARGLRTQTKNVVLQSEDRWSRPPPAIREMHIHYANLAASSIIRSLEQRWKMKLGVGFNPALFDLPDMGPSPVVSDRPIAVIRPPTLRTEWCNPARNPKPEYIVALAAELMATHTVVAVADLEPDREWLVGTLPPAHHHFVFGELKVRELLALVRDADIAIGGVGWLVPAGLALKTNTWIVLGGNGGHNAPEKITDPRLDLSRIGFAMPERFCRCTHMPHACDKTIADPLGQFARWTAARRAADRLDWFADAVHGSRQRGSGNTDRAHPHGATPAARD